MGELILGSVVDSITGQLVSLISQEIGGALGAKGELEKLRNTVDAIRAVFAEAEKRQIEEEPIKLWLKKLGNAFYVADDLLDDFATEILRRRRLMGDGGKCNDRMMKEVRIFFSSSNRLLFSLKMAHRVKAIRGTLDAIDNDKSKYSFKHDSTVNPALGGGIDRLKKKLIRLDDNPSFNQSNLIGRDDDKIKICDLLFSNSDENVGVVPIIGIGGLGKTTLAREIYNDKSVDKYFDLKFWVCVSENFDTDIIVGKILRSCGKKYEDCSADELSKKMEGKKYLLVLDDVWNENRVLWLNLMSFLENGAKGSKILVTTRSELVAEIMTRDIIYRLEGLCLDDSLSLLMVMANKKDHEWKNQRTEEIGRDIARKCGGVPLAIMTIGRLLCSKDTEKDWEVFNSREFVNIKQETGDILPTLKLSYDILPSQLKQCFTYCSLMPKDYELSRIELIELWMAQGFLKSPDNRSMEEVGNDYFMELVWGSFLQDIEKDVYGNVIMCKMHDLMHDLAEKEAGSNFRLVNNPNTAKYCHGEVFHVSVFNDDVAKWVGEEHNRARSLLCFEHVKEDSIKVILRNFRNTRVLWIIQGVFSDVMPKEIGKLNHLRSLDLNNSTFKALPPSISKLCNLETLGLEDCWNLIELPREITELVNLRHLNIKDCRKLTYMPKGIGKLTNLQMLSDFIVGENGNADAAGLDELGRLKGLTNDLRISHLERLGKGMNGSFPIKGMKLRSLELYWNWELREDEQLPTHSEEEEEKEVVVVEEEKVVVEEGKQVVVVEEEILDGLQPDGDLKGLIICGYMGCTLSSWVYELHKLVVLRIEDCKYCKQLPPIHQLPFLKSLRLKGLSEVEYIEQGYMSSAFFPSLEEIDMVDLPNFKGWVNLLGNNSQGEESPDEDDDFLLPVFPTVIRKQNIQDCPEFSYIGGDGHLSLMNVEDKYIHKWVRNNGTFQEVRLNKEEKATPTFRLLSFVPITELKSLDIGGFEGTVWRLILECFPVLESLKIRNWLEIDLTSDLEEELDQKLQHDLTNEEVVVEGVERMATMPWWFRHLSGLKILSIQNCDDLECLWRDRELDLNGELDGSSNNMDISELSVSTALGELTINVSRREFLPWWIGQLSNLRKLSIMNWENLKALPECLCDLTSLQVLELYECKALESLSRKVIVHLISTLQEWLICNCEKLDLNGELDEKDDAACISQLTMVPNLRSLGIGKNKAEFFPWWFEHLKNLDTLYLEEWDKLKALPEWLYKLTSLRYLSFNRCSWQIRERCKENGQDGAKISRISFVKVEGTLYREVGVWTPAAG